jgi:hypothetical protein
MLSICRRVLSLIVGGAIAASIVAIGLGPTATTISANAGAQDSLLESRDPEYLAGIATDIFAARILAVEKLVDVVNDPERPKYRTYYRVSITEIIKGGLRRGDQAIVFQHGGSDGCIATWFEGDGPLQIGDEYLFVTVRTREGDAYNIFAEGDGNIALGAEEERADEIEKWRSAVTAAGGTPVPQPTASDRLTPVATSIATTSDASPPSGPPAATPDDRQCETHYMI